MQANSQRFGEFNVADDEILTLPEGIIGFPNLTRWALLTVGSNLSLMWLQSLEDQDIAFPVAYPEEFHPNYITELSDQSAEALGLSGSTSLGEAPIQVLCIVSVSEDIEHSTINLKAPVVVNTDTLQGGQYDNLSASEDELRAPLWGNVRAIRLHKRLQAFVQDPADLVEEATQSDLDRALAIA